MAVSVGTQVRHHVVLINVEDTDPMIFGPYTKREAEWLVDLFNARIEAGVLPEGEYGWVHASSRQISNPHSGKAMLREFGVD